MWHSCGGMIFGNPNSFSCLCLCLPFLQFHDLFKPSSFSRLVKCPILSAVAWKLSPLSHLILTEVQ